MPPDAIQGTSVANYIIKKLKYKRVYIIDDQEAYSTGLADTVQQKLRAAGVTVTRDGVSQQQSDFSSLIAKIPRDTQLVYIPWQLPPKGKAFGKQMRSAGKGSIKLMGSDGLFDDVVRRRSATCTPRRSRPSGRSPDRHGLQEGRTAGMPSSSVLPSYVAGAGRRQRDRPCLHERHGHPRRGAGADPEDES